MEHEGQNAYEQVRSYARQLLHWFESAKEQDILAELDVGAANMTAMEAVMEHFNMTFANDLKSGGV